MGSDFSLQLSHLLEKLSAVSPICFRRRWRQTFKEIAHRLPNKPSIHPVSQSSHLFCPFMETLNEAPFKGEEEKGFGFIPRSTTSLRIHSQQIVTHNNSSVIQQLEQEAASVWTKRWQGTSVKEATTLSTQTQMIRFVLRVYVKKQQCYFPPIFCQISNTSFSVFYLGVLYDGSIQISV